MCLFKPFLSELGKHSHCLVLFCIRDHCDYFKPDCSVLMLKMLRLPLCLSRVQVPVMVE